MLSSQPAIPESFHVLLKELQSLGLAVELLREEEEQPGLAPKLGDGSPLYFDAAVDGEALLDGEPIFEDPPLNEDTEGESAGDEEGLFS